MRVGRLIMAGVVAVVMSGCATSGNAPETEIGAVRAPGATLMVENQGTKSMTVYSLNDGQRREIGVVRAGETTRMFFRVDDVTERSDIRLGVGVESTHRVESMSDEINPWAQRIRVVIDYNGRISLDASIAQ